MRMGRELGTNARYLGPFSWPICRAQVVTPFVFPFFTTSACNCTLRVYRASPSVFLFSTASSSFLRRIRSHTTSKMIRGRGGTGRGRGRGRSNARGGANATSSASSNGGGASSSFPGTQNGRGAQYGHGNDAGVAQNPIPIPPFDPDNYPGWSFDMECYLLAAECWGAIDELSNQWASLSDALKESRRARAFNFLRHALGRSYHYIAQEHSPSQPKFRVVLRYLMICLTAAQCSRPGFEQNLASAHTAYEMSGLVQIAMYKSDPMA